MITNDNFIEFCKKNYNNIHCLNEEEFENDLKTLRYVKSYFRRYIGGNDIKVEILINHFIYIHNCFGESMLKIMFFDFEDYYYPLLKTIFLYLRILPDRIVLNSENIIYTEDINIDLEFHKKLKSGKHNRTCF